MGSADWVKQEDWVPARLLPTSGIRSQNEQERRAASALLAVMSAVPDFCHALLSGIGVPKGAISTFTEVRLKDGNGERLHIPDGAIMGRARETKMVVSRSRSRRGGANMEPARSEALPGHGARARLRRGC